MCQKRQLFFIVLLVLIAEDYYAFGLSQYGRGYNGLAYRYGFNGKEKDQNNEWGSQTHYDYGFRIYNPAIGKFLSVDPLTRSYPMLTPYQFAGNMPIWAVDLDGLEPQKVTGIAGEEGTINGPYRNQEDAQGAADNGSATITYDLPEIFVTAKSRETEIRENYENANFAEKILFNLLLEVQIEATRRNNGETALDVATESLENTFNLLVLSTEPFAMGVGSSSKNVLKRNTQFYARAGDSPFRFPFLLRRSLNSGFFPGRKGVNVGKLRIPDNEMRKLSLQFEREFGLVYQLGPGKNGRGGSYYLYSGNINSTPLGPLSADKIVISHTHPFGYSSIPSKQDFKFMEQLFRNGSPQRKSKIIHDNGQTTIFSKDGYFIDGKLLPKK